MKSALLKALPTSIKEKQRWLDPTPLNVDPTLIGLPLATPARRAQAMAVDLLLMALLGGVGGFWLVCGLVLVVSLLRSKRLVASRRKTVGWVFAALLGLLAVQEAWNNLGPAGRVEREQARAEAKAEEKAEALAEAAEAGVKLQPESSASAASGGPDITDATRIVRLQAEIAELKKKPKLPNWRQQIDNAIESVGVSFGWGIVYFSLLPAWWGGQTLGKKLFRLRVMELTGKPLTVMRCLRRYGGYAAGMATGGLGFMQVLWDPNRQGIQDRVAHTVVVDLRAAPKLGDPLVTPLVTPPPAA